MAQNDFNPRTDLAVEEREQFTEGEEISGVAVDEWEGEGRLRLTRVEIKNEQGARAMGKPAGVYVTIESEALAENDPSYHEAAAGDDSQMLSGKRAPGRVRGGSWKYAGDSRLPGTKGD